MHPEIKQDKPGLCPECGMNLIPATDAGDAHHEHGGENGFDKHAGHTTNIFKRRFWVSLVLTVPVVLYSGILQTLFGFVPPAFTGREYVPAFLGSAIFFYGGWIFIISAVRELKARLPGMMTLISLAIVTAYLWSVYAVLSRSGDTLFWELSTLITVMLLGHWMEMRAVQGAQGALKELSKLLPDTAEVIRDGKNQTIPLSELREGDMVMVRPGGRIPADGVVQEGESDVNEAMITGESAPVKKKAASEVIAGTVNGDGALKVKVAKVGEYTFLAGVMRLVAEAQASKSRLQLLSDRAAYWLTIIAVVSGAITLLAWLAAHAAPSVAVNRLVAVLVIACPHALGLAIPLVASISTTLAARNGFLVKQRMALESARGIHVVLFDKTGTLTKGEYGVTDIWPVGAKDANELLQLAASVDTHSEHFISKAIVDKAKENGINLLPTKNFVRLPGKGVKGNIGKTTVFVGGEPILHDLRLAPPQNLQKQIKEEGERGKTVIYVAEEKRVLGVFTLADIIREESREAIRDLKTMGVRVAMITGDSEGVASWVAQELNIDEYFARVLPHEKSEKVKLLQQKGLKVAMVGDGINDAPALTQSDLGIAIGAGTNVAIESAGIILVRNDPRDIVKIIKLSRLTYAKMIQNLFWATGYNVVALPLAAGVLAVKGILLEPALAAVFMSASTVIVAVNALLLRRQKL